MLITIISFSSPSHTEFYRGIVTDINTDKDTYDVLYDDGEEDLYLSRDAVRRFVPYEIEEIVEGRIERFS